MPYVLDRFLIVLMKSDLLLPLTVIMLGGLMKSAVNCLETANGHVLELDLPSWQPVPAMGGREKYCVASSQRRNNVTLERKLSLGTRLATVFPQIKVNLTS